MIERRIDWTGSLGALGAEDRTLCAAALGTHGLDLVGAPLTGLAQRAPWAAALDTVFAATVATAGAAGLAAAVSLSRWGSIWLAAVAWGLAAVSFALSGHAATAAPVWLTSPSVALHAAAFIFWIGALPGIAAWARQGGSDLAALLARFSAEATPLVALLVATGTALAVVQVKQPEALIDTAYGRVLMAKLVAVAALLALAALNRFLLTPAIAAGDPSADRQLWRSMAGEIVLGLLILGLASAFRLTPPPRALDASAADRGPRPWRGGHGHDPASPGRAGPAPSRSQSQGTTCCRSRHGRRHRIRRCGERCRADTGRGGGGRLTWRAGPVYLPYAGQWSIALEILVSDFEKETLRATMPLPEERSELR